MTLAPRVTAVVVTYQSASLVGEALTALRAAYEAGDLRCIVVDNASADGTADLVRREHPWATLVAGRENLGYGSALNVGIAAATTEYVLLMNPDAVIGPGDLAALVRFLDGRPAAALAAPAIVEGEGVLQPAGVLPRPAYFLRHAAGLARGMELQRTIEPGGEPFATDWLCGAILLARKRALDRIGAFDPRFFLYFEETDLCRRVLDAGLELWAVGEAVCRHAGGASAQRSGKRLVANCIAEHYYRSRFYYLVKHHGWTAAVVTEILELCFLALRGVAAWCRGRPAVELRERLAGPVLRLPELPRTGPRSVRETAATPQEAGAAAS